MQIRAGNRQDETAIRALVSESLDLEGKDRDLRNIESSYFWFDGLCLVAEKDGEIIGFVAARPREQEEILELSRLAVAPSYMEQGVAAKLVDRVNFFAGNMDYEKIVAARSLAVERPLLLKLGFTDNLELPVKKKDG
ncbi:MAG: GNAT family N-acetyltransferase [Candidatus Obscuribacterales bacterium]|nr:GNAT family N-acetyltransferase [Candidatus Obscuribacterales bacterium]